MKKLSLVFLSVLLTAGIVQAQEPISFGIKGGINLSNFLLNDMDLLSSRMKVGPALGGFMKADITENFAIQPELQFFYRQSKAELEVGPVTFDDTFKQWGMQVPVYALGQTYAGNGLFYGGFGPFVGLGFDARIDELDFDLYEEISDNTAMGRWDFGLGVLLGYEFDNGLQLNADYRIGLINQVDEFNNVLSSITGKISENTPIKLQSDPKVKTQTVNISIGYRF